MSCEVCGETWRPFPCSRVRGMHPTMSEHARMTIQAGMLTWIDRHRNCQTRGAS